MTKKENNDQLTDEAMVKVLEQLLAEDTDITARAVARLHPSLAAASSITRNPMRMALLSKYQEQLAERRRWRGRVSHMSGAEQSITLAAKDARIAELEATVQLLTGSHVAMLRAVGELGGFSKWAKFYADYSAVRDKLSSLGALPTSTVHPFLSASTGEVEV
jgi:16S rRNA G527 N7-methylase RsmG